MRPRIVGLAIGVVATGVIAAVGLSGVIRSSKTKESVRTVQSAAQTEPGQRSPQGAALTTQVATLERRIASLERNAGAAASSAGPPRDRPRAGLFGGRRDPVTVAQEETARADAAQLQLDTRMGSEPLDPVWTRETKGRVQDALAKADVQGVKVSDITCRASACRVDLTHDPADASAVSRTHEAMLTSGAADGMDIWGRQAEDGRSALYLVKPEASPMRRHPDGVAAPSRP